MLDHRQFPEEAFAELYRRRWLAELFLRDIKIAMNMDVLRCKTPDMVDKELYMHLIAYNLVRALMLQAATKKQVSPLQLSFKGTVATVRQWAPLMVSTSLSECLYKHMFDAMLNAIVRDPVPERPDRAEPRARKRRPKNYQLLTKPRREFRECPHRSRYVKA
ncbi:MAG: Transposase DDE domain protein [Candidatus Hydrogenedentes bacterium ADurb.Bin101]|nr:MAG: Transposase DDE domain protein [Candidatus Hydrogenedentes bacterium ADurb.Bin101]